MRQSCVLCAHGQHTLDDSEDFCDCCGKPVAEFTEEERYNAGVF